MPWARKPKVHNPAGPGSRGTADGCSAATRWSAVSPWPFVVVLALPIGSMRLGFTDDGGRPEGSSARIAYDLLAEGFGPGLNGPFIVTAETAEPR